MIRAIPIIALCKRYSAVTNTDGAVMRAQRAIRTGPACLIGLQPEQVPRDSTGSAGAARTPASVAHENRSREAVVGGGHARHDS